MSKILEALQKPMGRESQKPQTPQPEKPQTQSSPKQVHRLTQEQLADVYFQGSGKKAELPPPTIIRVAEKERSFFIPWLITVGALCLVSFALFSTKRISIDIRVMDETPPVREAVSRPQPTPSDAITPGVVNPAFLDPAPLQEIPEAIALSPLDFSFAGAAVLNSSRDRNQLTLTNSTLSGLAYAVMNFETPFPASRYQLTFEARGRMGGENIELIFKDVYGNSSLNWKTVIPVPGGLTTEWQAVQIRLEGTQYFHPDAIKQMRIEIGTQRSGNPSEAVVFLRNMQWLPVETAGGGF